MKSFEYAAPKKLKDAVQLLGQQWGETEILAGGTDLLTSLKQGITQPKRLVSLRQVKGLSQIKHNRQGTTLGAMVTLDQLASHSDIKRQFPALTSAIRAIASPQITGRGTLGGDLCQRPRCWYFRNGYGLLAQQKGASLVRNGENRYHAIFGNDGPALFVSASSLGPALLALDASLTAVGPGGREREIPAAEFFRIPRTDRERETALQPDEILTRVFLPASSSHNATYEIRHRHGLDWPYVSASVAFQLQKGVALQARVVLGQVAPIPWPVPEAARLLEQAPLNIELANQCGQAAAQGAKPLSGNAYKVHLVKTAVKRAVLAAIGA